MGEPFTLLIRQEDGRSRAALVSGQTLLEYHEEDAGAGSLVGTVYVGKVERVLPDIKAAFVKLGLPLNGFLPLRESESYHRACGDAPLMSGQEILVQARKDPKGGKGAFLSRDITFPGQYVLLMPMNRFIGVSKRVTDERERNRAKALGRAVAGNRFGVIVRHAALYVSEQEVRAEAEALWERWQQMSERARYTKAPAVLHREPSQAEILARDYAARHPITVYAAAPALRSFPEGVTWRQLDADALAAEWRGARVDEQLSAALRRRVELNDGGSLVIDEREALQTVDVNSGANVHEAGASLALAENLRAVPEIARQIRLRNLSGILLIDFIDMDTDADRQRVQAAMEQAVADDRVKTVIHGFTQLGLLEMTRKRMRDTLRDALTEPCAACRESGRVRRAHQDERK